MVLPSCHTPPVPLLSLMPCPGAGAKAKARGEGRESGEATREAATAPAEQVATKQPQDPGNTLPHTLK